MVASEAISVSISFRVFRKRDFQPSDSKREAEWAIYPDLDDLAEGTLAHRSAMFAARGKIACKQCLTSSRNSAVIIFCNLLQRSNFIFNKYNILFSNARFNGILGRIQGIGTNKLDNSDA